MTIAGVIIFLTFTSQPHLEKTADIISSSKDDVRQTLRRLQGVMGNENSGRGGGFVLDPKTVELKDMQLQQQQQQQPQQQSLEQPPFNGPQQQFVTSEIMQQEPIQIQNDVNNLAEPNNEVKQPNSGIPNTMGYFNLSCPFEWYKYSCAALQENAFDEQVTAASKQYYLDHLPEIWPAFDSTLNLSDHNQNLPQPKRIFMTGDSLLRQVFVSVACNAFSLNAIEQSEVNWGETWPCPKGFSKCIDGGQHSGFDSASIRFKNGMEIHYVSHEGIPPGDWPGTERDVLLRMKRQIETRGEIDFGTKTAFPPSGKMDVLVYNLGAHESPAKAKRDLNMFASNIAVPLMKKEERPKIVYVTTPTAHFNTPNGQYILGQMDESKKQCIDRVSSNPKADLEKKILKAGINVDVLLDYDDLELGALHVHKGDCLHYCMPGVVDLVGARLLESF